jgi:cytochrome b subunit of formate dehydrogenase
MNPFHYAKSFYSNLDLPQQLTWAFALLLLSLVAVMAGVALIRRAFGEPRRSSTGALPPPGIATFERYEVGARLWHVGLVGILLALGISGAAFYAPGSVPGPLPVLGLSWLYVHLAFGLMFMLGILVHIIKAPQIDPRQMWFDRRDWHQLVAGARYYLGLPHELPKLGKYGVWSKVFHIALVLLALIMIVSGISLSLDTLGWAVIDQNWQRGQRLLHDFGTFGFLFLVVGHVFWQLLKSRSQTKAMVTGTIATDTFSANHDWDRWNPHAASHDAKAGKVDHGQ